MGVTVKLLLVDTHKYDSILLPAYQAFIQRSDPKQLAALIRQAPTSFAARRQRAILASLEGYTDMLDDNSGGTSKADMLAFINNSVAQDLFRFYCMARVDDINPEQNMSRTALMQYLYSQSKWIEDYFTFAKEPSGPVLDVKIGEWSRLYSADEVMMFDEELSRIARPADPQILEEGFDNLRRLVQAATSQKNMKLLLSVM